jgi:thiol-disulfide isomerase/thioredoxin
MNSKMKQTAFINLYSALFVLTALLSGCSRQVEEPPISSTNENRTANLPTQPTPVLSDKDFLPALDVDFLKSAPSIEGKPVLLEFWATWCPPCLESIPHLNEFHKKYGDKGLIIIGVTSEDKATITEFTKKVPMNYFVGTDPDNKLHQALEIQTIPFAFLTDKNHRIVWVGHPMELDEKKLQEVLK